MSLTFLARPVLAALAVLFPSILWGAARAQPDLAPPPLVRAAPPGPQLHRERLPGEAQPIAPGTRAAPALPQLFLTPPIPEVRRIEYAGNGFIEVAHALVLVDARASRSWRLLAAEVARRTLNTRPSLAEVDVSVYDEAGYHGFGGPLPLFTASVPRARLGDFLAFATGDRPYERAWTRGDGFQRGKAPLNVFERVPNFVGNASELLRQQVDQAIAQFRGGERGGLLFKGSLSRPVAALTFDDAPHPLYEPLLLDLLRRAHVKATFFVIGRNAQAYPYFVRDMVLQGHEVGNHTYHHVRLPGLSAGDVREELSRADDVISGLTGQPVRYFRPPGGDYSPLTLRVARDLGLTTTFWTDDPGDFANPGVTTLEARLSRHLRRGGIVLLHDNAPQTIRVLPVFLSLAARHGLTLTTVGTLARSP